MTRIVAGSARGRSLRVPSQGTRPTSAKVREAIFSKLYGWGLLDGSRALDLFAGSGALGLEALSRGASSAVFVERSKSALNVVRNNASQLGFADKSTFFPGGAFQYLRSSDAVFDLVFVDPPYSWSEEDLSQLLSMLVGVISEGGIIVVERTAASPAPSVPATLILEDHRVWGETAAWFLGSTPVSP